MFLKKEICFRFGYSVGYNRIVGAYPGWIHSDCNKPLQFSIINLEDYCRGEVASPKYWGRDTEKRVDTGV